MNDVELRALQYVKNTGRNAPITAFDDDHEPIGPELRRALMPKYMVENISEDTLILTAEGEAAIKAIK